MPVRSGPMRVPSPLWTWHLAQAFLNTNLPAAGVARLLVSGSNSSRTFCRSGLGSAAAAPRSSCALARIRPVGMLGQRLLLIERQLRQLDLPLVEARPARLSSSPAGPEAR